MIRRSRRSAVLFSASVVAAMAIAGCGSAATPAPSAPGRVPTGSGTFEHTITAKGIAFDLLSLEVKADQPFQVYFRNQDPGSVPHDIDIRDGAGGKILDDKPTIDGGKEVVYDFKALPAGTYKFECSVHPIPAMTGTLTVK